MLLSVIFTHITTLLIKKDRHDSGWLEIEGLKQIIGQRTMPINNLSDNPTRKIRIVTN